MPKSARRIFNFITENMMLTGILACVSISIMARSYFHDFHISHDSTHFLRAARELLRGNGFYVYSDTTSWPYSAWFAVWPIGYPLLIAATSFVTRTEPYLASTILSIIIVWLIGIMLCKRFGRTAWGYALVMLNAGFLNTFYHPWSEVPFIFGLVMFSFWTSDIITENTVRASQYIKLTLAALLLFLSRYVGAFAIGVIGLLWIYNVFLVCRFKDMLARKRVKFLTISGIFSGIFIASYLLLNRTKTGFMTGLDRANQYHGIPPDSIRELTSDLYRAQLIEMNNVFSTLFRIDNNALALPLWFAFAAFVIYVIFKNAGNIKALDKTIITPVVFLAVGVIYWFAIVAMRFTSAFDNFSYRLLLPSTALLFIGFVGLLTQNKKINAFISGFCGITHIDKKTDSLDNSLKAIAAVCFSFLILTQLVFAPMLSGTLRYRDARNAVLAGNAHIPDGATVLWGNENQILTLYLRDDVTSLPYFTHHGDLDSFFELFENREVYVYVPGMREKMDRALAGSEDLPEFFEQFRDSSQTHVRVK